MFLRQILIGFLIFATLVIPIVQLSFGFHNVDKQTSCPLEPDIMLLMAIGGFFEVIFFAACFGLIYTITPVKYKNQKNQTIAQQSAKGNSRASHILIGLITSILGACAIVFFVLIQYRVYQNYANAQWTNSTNTNTYCDFTIFSSAFGLMIATYVAILFIILVAIILLCGLCTPKN